jgi:hypothetical protein
MINHDASVSNKIEINKSHEKTRIIMPAELHPWTFSGIGNVNLGNAQLPYKYIYRDLTGGITKTGTDFLCTVRQITVQRMNK